MGPETVSDTVVPMRPADQIMRLSRLGSLHQTRLSFMRSLLRELARARYSFSRPLWQVDERGQGIGVYAAIGPQRIYHLIAFAHDLDPSLRTDRVIATAWDATFVLFDGTPDEADLVRLCRSVPKQEAGRFTSTEIILSRANRSVRLFDYVVARLAAGCQPAVSELDSVGYLMRTTAVYGNGKFGLADRDRIKDRAELAGPFHAEMLSVWLIRAFTIDIVEHLARVRAPNRFVPLATELRRRLGVGNATGLGMAPFLINHPVLLNNWILARETALARVRRLSDAARSRVQHFRNILRRSRAGLEFWRVDDPLQASRIEELRQDLGRLTREIDSPASFDGAYPWNRLFGWAENALGLEAQEFLVTLILEPYGDLVDDLAATMVADEAAHFSICGTMSVGEAVDLLARHYPWALDRDYRQPSECARFWYVSAEKLEPRLGERRRDEGSERELPLDIGRAMQALAIALAPYAQRNPTLAEFLLAHPEHRMSVRRLQISATHPYAEIRDNLLAADMRPVDLLRCKLSFFGAANFDPKSDRWTRITMFQHAPQPDEFAQFHPDDWVYPPLASEHG
jgi:hypothetical protein